MFELIVGADLGIGMNIEINNFGVIFNHFKWIFKSDAPGHSNQGGTDEMRLVLHNMYVGRC